MTTAITNRMTGPWVNVAAPESTPADVLDQQLGRWASLQLHRLRTREIARHDITQELRKMPEEKQAGAKRWLNHYRAMRGG